MLEGNNYVSTTIHTWYCMSAYVGIETDFCTWINLLVFEACWEGGGAGGFTNLLPLPVSSCSNFLFFSSFMAWSCIFLSSSWWRWCFSACCRSSSSCSLLISASRSRWSCRSLSSLTFSCRLWRFSSSFRERRYSCNIHVLVYNGYCYRL